MRSIIQQGARSLFLVTVVCHPEDEPSAPSECVNGTASSHGSAIDLAQSMVKSASEKLWARGDIVSEIQ